jgi:hypothetical protein
MPVRGGLLQGGRQLHAVSGQHRVRARQRGPDGLPLRARRGRPRWRALFLHMLWTGWTFMRLGEYRKFCLYSYSDIHALAWGCVIGSV